MKYVQSIAKTELLITPIMTSLSGLAAGEVDAIISERQRQGMVRREYSDIEKL